jgi:DNA replication protein DnaC
MHEQLAVVKNLLGHLNLTTLRKDLDDMLLTATNSNYTYLEFLKKALKSEAAGRNARARDRRLRMANFPYQRTSGCFPILTPPGRLYLSWVNFSLSIFRCSVQSHKWIKFGMSRGSN